MHALQPRTIFVLLVSLVCVISLAEAFFKQACVNKPLILSCPLKEHSSQNVWRYKEHQGWHDIAFFSKEKSYLSPNIPGKFKGVTNISANGSLIFSSFSSMLIGIYDCQSYGEGQVHHTMIKSVAVNCEKTVCEGDNTVLECEVLKYKDLLYLNQPRKITWKKGRTPLANMTPSMNVTNPNYTQPYLDGALNLGPASKAFDGQRYTCVVYGEIEVTPKRYSVIVKVKKCQQKILDACEGERIDLKCPHYLPMAQYANDIRLEWYNGSTMIAHLLKLRGNTIPSKSSFVKVNKSNGAATFVSPSVFDNGLYICKILRERKLLKEYSVTLNVTPCLSTTGSQKPKKEVQGKYVEKQSVAEPTVGKESSDEVRKEEPFPYGFLVVFVLPMLIGCMVMKLRPNVNQQQRIAV